MELGHECQDFISQVGRIKAHLSAPYPPDVKTWRILRLVADTLRLIRPT